MTDHVCVPPPSAVSAKLYGVFVVATVGFNRSVDIQPLQNHDRELALCLRRHDAERSGGGSWVAELDPEG